MISIQLEMSGLKNNRVLPLLIFLPKITVIYDDKCPNIDQSWQSSHGHHFISPAPAALMENQGPCCQTLQSYIYSQTTTWL